MKPIALLALAASIVLTAITPEAAVAAQPYPAKPIRLINPYPPGGATDIVSRSIALEMGKALGQPVVVENKSGAGGNVGAELVAKSEPDGYTILLAPISLYAIAPVLYAKMNYDPIKDLAPVIVLTSSGFVLVVHPSVKAESVKELIALAKAQPGKLSFASVGNGSMVHLQGEMFKQMAGVDILHVPYRGATLAVTDLLTHQVDMTFDNVPTAVPNIRAGKLRALAVTGTRREAALPEVPTFAEAGVPGYEAVTYFFLAAPANTPKEIIAKLNAAAAQGILAPDFIKRMADMSFDIIGGSPEFMGKVIDESVKRWTPVVKSSGAKIN